MFQQQQIILESTPAIRELVSRYQWQTEPANWLDSAEDKSREFVVPVPLVGAFSAGKSSLINALIGSQVFAYDIDPQTAVPAEVRHGNTESFTGCLPDGRRIPLDREAVRENRLEALQNGGWVEAVLPIPQLASLSHLRLVDMPGWDSGVQAHGAAIDNYASRSLAYGVVVSADEGNLRDSIRKALKELAVRDMPIFAVVSKADKKPPEDVDDILAQVRQEITNTMGKPPFMVVKASIRKNGIGEFFAALQALESQAETLFAKNIAAPFARKLQSLDGHLATLLNSDDLDSEKIQAQCEQLKADMQAFEVRLNDETAQLDARVQPVLGRIVQHLEACLTAQLDSLADKALNGSDLQGSIGTTTRLAVEQGIRDEFNPEIERYLNRVADGLPPNFSPDVSCAFNFSKGQRNESDDGLVIAPLLSTILPFLKFIPKLNIVGPIIVGVVTLLEKLFQSKGNQELEAAQQREEARQALLTQVIPNVTGQVKAALQPLLHAHVQEAKQKIIASVGAQQASHGAALNELQEKLGAGQAAFAQACNQYKADQAFIQTLLTQLENA